MAGVTGWACAAGAGRAEHRGATVLYASGADLQTINPLHTVHPLAKQVQRYVLLTTLARYDSALRPTPYLARAWTWSPDGRTLVLRLRGDLRWHDGRPTTARDAAWTLAAARAPETGYARVNELADLAAVAARDDTTLVLGFSAPPRAFPDVLTDLAVVPSHLLDTVPRAMLRRAAWNRARWPRARLHGVPGGRAGAPGSAQAVEAEGAAGEHLVPRLGGQ